MFGKLILRFCIVYTSSLSEVLGASTNFERTWKIIIKLLSGVCFYILWLRSK